MSSPIPVVRRFLARTRTSVRAARPGSILILVVALLVLVAIIGTAALSTNTIDRYATGQNNVNTQVDLLVEGVKNMAKSVLVSDIKDAAVNPATYRPPEGVSKTYDHWDMPLLVYPTDIDPTNPANLIKPPRGADPLAMQLLLQANDAWLSPRYPVLQDPRNLSTFTPTATGSLVLGTNPPVWDCIGAPLEYTNGAAPVGQKLFDSPGVFTGESTGVVTGFSSYDFRITNRSTAQEPTGGFIFNPMVPRFVTYTNSAGQTVQMPAWQFTNVDPNNPNQAYYFIAGDADGDGIADSGLKRLAIGEINGLTYYYAVRIIDNGSAINVNTAISRDHEALGDVAGTFVSYNNNAGTPVPNFSQNFFSSSIGLAEMLRSSTSLTAISMDQLQANPNTGTFGELGWIDAYRMGGPSINFMRPTGIIDTSGNPRGTPYADKAPGAASGTLTVPRNDFAYNTLGELVYFGLSRRLDNPGVVAQAAGVDTRFRRFSVSESAALAYHFTLVNPDASKSILEQATSSGVPPYSNVTPQLNQLDSLYLSASNKIPNSMRTPPLPAVGNTFDMLNKKQFPSTLYGVGYWFADNFDWDQDFDVSGNFLIENPLKFRNRRTMFTADNPVSNQIPSPGQPPYVQKGFTKASVNTASFYQLFSGFFSVMTEGPESPYRIVNASPANPQPAWSKVPPTPEEFYLYAGMKHTAAPITDDVSNQNDPQQPASFIAQAGDVHIDRMFRNSIRDHGPAARIGDRDTKYDENTGTMSAGPVSDTRNSVHLHPATMRKLRAYLAAANTVSMRAPARKLDINGIRVQQNTTEPLLARINNADAQVDLFVYPAEPQPFITEIYVNTDTVRAGTDYDATASPLPNLEPYVAIELFFPYEVRHPTATTVPPGDVTTAGTGAPWDMRPYTTLSGQQYPGWSIGLINRAAAGNRNANGVFTNGVPPLHTITFATNPNAYFDEPTTADPRYGSYIILENYDETGGDTTSPVRYRPRSSGLPAVGPIGAAHVAGPNTPPVKSIYVRNLARVVLNGSTTPQPNLNGGELVIFKPVVDNSLDEDRDANYIPPRPIDSFDFTGLEQQSSLGFAYVWHYSRLGKQAAVGGIGEFWSFIYPGRYDGGLGAAPDSRRHQGTQAGRWRNPVIGDPLTGPGVPGYYDPFDPALNTAGTPLDPRPSLGSFVDLAGTRTSDDNASPQATYHDVFKTQLMNYDQPGWNPIGGYVTVPPAAVVPPNKFPFGAFARNTDIMQIPYFGAYRIRPFTPYGTPIDRNDIEVNAMPIDASFCEDTDVYDDELSPTALPLALNLTTFEQLGRFCPVTSGVSGAVAGAEAVDDLDPTPGRTYRYGAPDPDINTTTGLPNTAWRYRWTTRLFDFLTVQDPQSDYLPNVTPSSYGVAPELVSNDGGTAGDPNSALTNIATAESAAPLQGLININTASWRVLSAINWTPYALSDTANRDKFHLVEDPDGEFRMETGPNTPIGVPDNLELAKAITWWRDGKDAPTTLGAGPIGPKGPFRSLYDLYRVKALRTYYNQIGAAAEPDDFEADFSPFNANPLTMGTQPHTMPKTDEIRYDFEERFPLIDRVSSLITTRADSFTVYIVVQGWRNANSTDSTKPPELVVQRRAAFIADRSGVTATGGALKITNVASE